MRAERQVSRWRHTLRKNSVDGIEKENGLPWASSLRCVRLELASAELEGSQVLNYYDPVFTRS